MNRGGLTRTRRRPARFTDAAARSASVKQTRKKTAATGRRVTTRATARRSRGNASVGALPASTEGTIEGSAAIPEETTVFIPATPVFSSSGGNLVRPPVCSTSTELFSTQPASMSSQHIQGNSPLTLTMGVPRPICSDTAYQTGQMVPPSLGQLQNAHVAGSSTSRSGDIASGYSANLVDGGELRPLGPRFSFPTTTPTIVSSGHPPHCNNGGLHTLPADNDISNSPWLNRPTSTTSAVSPLGIHVPQAVRDKICQGLFVDFSLLYNDAATAVIARSREQQATNLTLAVEGGNVVLKKPGLHRKKIETFDMWQSAFNVFMSIYIARHPSRCLELLKYAELIRTASIQFPGFGWRAYDEQFRLRQEANPGRSWGEIDFELWLTVAAASVTSPAARGANIPPPTYRSKNIRHGHCFAYNSASGCNFTNCKFAHTCQKCMRAGHGATRCRSAGQMRGTMSPNAQPSRAPAVRNPQANDAATKPSSYAPLRRTPLSANPKPLQSSSPANQAHSFRPSNTN